jgi:hypothetical protein
MVVDPAERDKNKRRHNLDGSSLLDTHCDPNNNPLPHGHVCDIKRSRSFSAFDHFAWV